jgi:hypothetical protein
MGTVVSLAQFWKMKWLGGNRLIENWNSGLKYFSAARNIASHAPKGFDNIEP